MDGKSLANDIYNDLKNKILYLKISPGTLLTEKSLAEFYEISKTPVREALSRLSVDNLVMVIPHKGYVVTKITVGDFKSLFQYRKILESAATGIAVQQASEFQIEKLQKLAEIEPDCFDENNYHSINSKVNDDFHLYLVGISNNPLLIQSHCKVMEQLKRVLLKDTKENTVHAIVEEHSMVVALIKQKKKEEAEKFIAEHIERTMNRVINSL